MLKTVFTKPRQVCILLVMSVFDVFAAPVSGKESDSEAVYFQVIHPPSHA
jgi:hypothetical protein